MENDTLVDIPLFLFMGYVVERANIVNKLFYSLQMAATSERFQGNGRYTEGTGRWSKN